MRAYRVIERSDRQMAFFRQGVAHACLRLVVAKFRRPEFSIEKRHLNGFSLDSRSEDRTDSISVLSDNTPQLIDKFL